MQAREVDLDWEKIEQSIRIFSDSHQTQDEKSVRDVLLKYVNGYIPADN